MGSDNPARVDFPVSADGRRSTSALGRAVVAAALRAVDPAGAKAAEQESNWRRGYLGHFRRLIEAGLPASDAALSVARNGLDALHQRMRVVTADGAEAELSSVPSAAPAGPLPSTVTLPGAGAAEQALAIPYRGERLTGGALLRQLDGWVARGIIEPSCAEAVRSVAGHPEWLALPGHTVVVLGAGAEVGPLPVLLGWGVRVVGVDLPRPDIWSRVLEMARQGAGTLEVPARPGDADLAERAGLDLAADLPAVADWLASIEGPLVLGNYVYAGGAANVRVASAVDALTVRLHAARPDAVLAFLATPTDVFAVPPDAVAESRRRFRDRSLAMRLGQVTSGGRLFRPAYPPGPAAGGPGVNDSMIAQQGPNYVLAKRIQRWRATVARHAGSPVSLNVAPPTSTRSVLTNRILAAAYAGAPRFGVEVFDPATTRTLMAALLVHDVCAGGLGSAGVPGGSSGGAARAHPWQEEAHAAAHGGLWRIPYAPRTALPVAAVLGYPASRHPPGQARR